MKMLQIRQKIFENLEIFDVFFQKEQIQNLPETTNFSQMWKHLTTGNILKDHVQIRVVLGFKTKR